MIQVRELILTVTVSLSRSSQNPQKGQVPGNQAAVSRAHAIELRKPTSDIPAGRRDPLRRS
jgi:hypothetical protein